MRKVRSFEENTVQNLEIEHQFQKLMQIEGLDQASQKPKEPFPSLKDIFHNNTLTNIIGAGPNANIRAFNYLLLCHIRKEHLKQLQSTRLQQEADRLSSEDQGFSRDRRVSFNGRGAVFLNGPQYQNYALHKLRIYSFSKSTDLTIIQNTPLLNDKQLWFNKQPMESLHLKKLLSQFLKQLLPEELPKEYKKKLKSVQYHLNRHRVVGIILEIVMRNILYSNYEIQSAKNYQEQVNDHTVCTTLCDAFAIDGLMCRDNLYEINTWCKVYSIILKKEKIIFVEMFNDEFQQTGITNEKEAQNIKRDTEQKLKEHQVNSIQQFETCELKSQSVDISDFKSESERRKKSEVSSSMMDKDEDSEMDSNLSNHSQENKGQSYYEQTSPPFGNNFSSKKKTNISDLQEQSERQSDKESYANNHEQQYEQVRQKLQQFLKSNSFIKKSDQTIQKSEPYTNDTGMSDLNLQTNSSKKLEKKTNFTTDCTPPNFFEQIGVAKPKPKDFSKKSSQEQGSSIINNNISNNIYLNLGENTQYRPVINISTSKKDPKGFKINLG